LKTPLGNWSAIPCATDWPIADDLPEHGQFKEIEIVISGIRQRRLVDHRGLIVNNQVLDAGAELRGRGTFDGDMTEIKRAMVADALRPPGPTRPVRGIGDVGILNEPFATQVLVAYKCEMARIFGFPGS
jgi:hypothetical protein